MRLSFIVPMMFLFLTYMSSMAYARVIRKTIKMPNTNAWVPLGRAVVVHRKIGTVNIYARLTYPYHKNTIKHYKSN